MIPKKMKKAKITDFVPAVKNPNRHTAYGEQLLEKSIQGDGWIGAATAADDGEIIAGSARQGVAVEKFANVEPIVILSDGSRPVIIKRIDIKNANTARARRLATADNAVASANYDPDGALLAEWASEDDQIRKMFLDDEWMKINYESEHPKTLEELEAEYGNSKDDDFYPFIRIKVTPEIKKRFDAVMVLMPGANEMKKIDALISRGELS